MTHGFTHQATPHSDVIYWSNWHGRKGASHYLTLLGVGVQALLVGVGAGWLGRLFVFERGGGWLALYLGLLAGLVWLIGRQLLPLVHKHKLVVGDETLVLYEIGPWRTTHRTFATADVEGVRYEKRAASDWEAQLVLVVRVRPFGREPLELRTHYPVAPWLNAADQQALYTLLAKILAARGVRAEF